MASTAQPEDYRVPRKGTPPEDVFLWFVRVHGDKTLRRNMREEAFARMRLAAMHLDKHSTRPAHEYMTTELVHEMLVILHIISLERPSTRKRVHEVLGFLRPYTTDSCFGVSVGEDTQMSQPESQSQAECSDIVVYDHRKPTDSRPEHTHYTKLKDRPSWLGITRPAWDAWAAYDKGIRKRPRYKDCAKPYRRTKSARISEDSTKEFSIPETNPLDSTKPLLEITDTQMEEPEPHQSNKRKEKHVTFASSNPPPKRINLAPASSSSPPKEIKQPERQIRARGSPSKTTISQPATSSRAQPHPDKAKRARARGKENHPTESNLPKIKSKDAIKAKPALGEITYRHTLPINKKPESQRALTDLADGRRASETSTIVDASTQIDETAVQETQKTNVESPWPSEDEAEIEATQQEFCDMSIQEDASKQRGKHPGNVKAWESEGYSKYKDSMVWGRV